MLRTYHRQFQTFFQRREQWRWSWLYLCGQLSELERKTIEPMVLHLLGSVRNAVRAVQQFIGRSPWPTEPMLAHLQLSIALHLGDPDGVVIADGSGFPKQGEHSVGVAHQYCGHIGKIANCQQGVFLVYASARGYTFLDERLYLPEDWFVADTRARWSEWGIPTTQRFQTEPALALEMIVNLVNRAILPFRWVACDETYGKNPVFLAGIETLGKWYLAEVPANTRVWQHTPRVEPPGPGLWGRPRLHPRVTPTAARPQELRQLIRQLPATQWRRYTIKEGSKGPMTFEFACLRVTPVRDTLPAPRSWALIRRSLADTPEVKFYLSNAPATCAPQALMTLSGQRWPVETVLEEAKGEVGMDHYETRTWVGWHHHMMQTFMAHWFLVQGQLHFQKKSGHNHSSSPPIGGAST